MKSNLLIGGHVGEMLLSLIANRHDIPPCEELKLGEYVSPTTRETLLILFFPGGIAEPVSFSDFVVASLSRNTLMDRIAQSLLEASDRCMTQLQGVAP